MVAFAKEILPKFDALDYKLKYDAIEFQGGLTTDSVDFVHLIVSVKRNHMKALELNETGLKEFERQMDIALQLLIIYTSSFSMDFG